MNKFYTKEICRYLDLCSDEVGKDRAKISEIYIPIRFEFLQVDDKVKYLDLLKKLDTWKVKKYINVRVF